MSTDLHESGRDLYLISNGWHPLLFLIRNITVFFILDMFEMCV